MRAFRFFLSVCLSVICFETVLLQSIDQARAVDQIFISEVNPAPASGESEWVELCNPSNETVDLTAHYLMDQVSTPSLLVTFSNSTIAPLSALVVNIAGSKLNNTGDSVLLYSPANQAIDQVTYENASPGQSFSRLSNNQILNSGTPSPDLCLPSHFPPTPTTTAYPTPTSAPIPTNTPTPNPTPTPTSTPTPASPTPTKTPTPKPSPTATPTPTSSLNVTTTNFDPNRSAELITVSEIMACPESGSSEWLRVFNKSSETLNLANWKLLDAVGNTITLNLNLPPNSYTIFEFTKAILNNSGDTIEIQSPDGALRFQIDFGSCQTGQSFSLINDEYVLSSPSPNRVSTSTTSSTITSPTPTPSRTPTPTQSNNSTLSTIPFNQLSQNSSEPLDSISNTDSILGATSQDYPHPLLSSPPVTTSDAKSLTESSLSATLSSPPSSSLPLIGSSVGGGLMLSSGLGMVYATWKTFVAFAW